MFLAKIKGNVVSTQKNSHLNGHKLLTLRRIDLDGNFIGSDDMIALDTVDAGIGDVVLVVKEGGAVQQILGHKKAPVHTIIVAVVDDMDISE